MSNNRPVLRAMISSTTLDLPAHRDEAMDACLRQDFFPLMMEHLPADSIAGLAASMRLADYAQLYIRVGGVDAARGSGRPLHPHRRRTLWLCPGGRGEVDHARRIRARGGARHPHLPLHPRPSHFPP